MSEANLAGQTIQLGTKTMDAVGNIAEALIGAFGEGCRDAASRAVYGEFKQHVANGGGILGCPISVSRVDLFEQYAQANSISYSIIYEHGNNENATILFMDKDKAPINKVIDHMLEDGLPLIKDMQLTVEELINGLDGDGLDETVGDAFKTKEDILAFKVGANKNGLHFAVKQREQADGYIILTANKDFAKMIGTAGMTGINTTHLNDLATMQQVKEEVAKERKNMERQSSKDTTKERDFER